MTVHVMRETNLQDVPAALRGIAARIEAGEFGTALGCAVVLRADVIRTFYAGRGEAFPTAHLLLHIGAASMLKAIE